MRAVVDSGEFGRAVRAAARYTKTTGLSISEIMLLTAVDDAVIIRTTTGSEDCIVRVNAFEVEGGVVAIPSSILVQAAYDSGGLVDISLDGTRLLIKDDKTSLRIGTTDKTEEDFPVWLLPPILIEGISTSILKTASLQTTPFSKTGHAIKSSIHMVNDGDKVAMFATDGICGFMHTIDGSIDSLVSIDAQMLMKALSVTGDIVDIHAQGGRLVVSNDVASVSFSSVAIENVDNVLAAFSVQTDYGPAELDQQDVVRIASLCNMAANIYQMSEMEIIGGSVRIAGIDVNINTEIEADLPRSIFRCSTFSRFISNLLTNESMSISVKMMDEYSQFWYVDNQDGRYFVFSSRPEFIKSD